MSSTKDLRSDNYQIKLMDMKSALKHRGPDGDGDYTAPSGAAVLCHTRLSIIDLSDAGHQPMLSKESRYSITFNGEIYNYRELREELTEAGEDFQSNSDTEVLLKLFQRYGANCVEKLRGMFAFVIWDEREKSAFAARDPLGIKPLYYCSDASGDFAFASEVRALLKASHHTEKLSPQGIYNYLSTGTFSEPNTILNDVKLLEAGHTLTWKAGSASVSNYWQIKTDLDPSAITEIRSAIKLTRKALNSSIEAHLVSDVPVGIFLSGGIDSTALLALASQYSKKAINTYSIAFENKEWNEGDIAARVAEHFGANHTEFLVTPEIALPMFDDFLKAVDQPTIDGFNSYCVSKLAQNQGEKVVLSGLGGDELFAGYKSFELVPKLAEYSRRISLLAPLARWLNRSLISLLPSKLLRILDLASHPGSLSAAYQSLRGIFSHHETLELCERLDLHVEHSLPNRSLDHSYINPKTRVSELELTGYMRNQLLRDSDVMSMACGLELRVPFVDRQLLETMTRVHPDIRLRQGKKLLIEAVPEIPDWVINRPKQGFRFPFDLWFANKWKDIEVGYDTPTWLSLSPWYRKWSLTVLAAWQKRHLSHLSTDK